MDLGHDRFLAAHGRRMMGERALRGYCSSLLLRVYGQNKIKSGTKFLESSQVLPNQNVFSEPHRGSFISTPFRVCKHGDLVGSRIHLEQWSKRGPGSFPQ